MLRVDSTLLALRETKKFFYKNVEGDRSFIFIASETGATTFIDMDHAERSYTKVAFEGDCKTIANTIDVSDEKSFQLSQKPVHLIRVIKDDIYAVPEKTLFLQKHASVLVGDLKCYGYDIKGIRVCFVL